MNNYVFLSKAINKSQINFGTQVVSNDNAVYVSAPQYFNSKTGVIFEYDINLVQKNLITPTQGSSDDNFPVSIAANNKILLASSLNAVYVYSPANTNTPLQVIYPPLSQGDSIVNFGMKLAISYDSNFLFILSSRDIFVYNLIQFTKDESIYQFYDRLVLKFGAAHISQINCHPSKNLLLILYGQKNITSHQLNQFGLWSSPATEIIYDINNGQGVIAKNFENQVLNDNFYLMSSQKYLCLFRPGEKTNYILTNDKTIKTIQINSTNAVFSVDNQLFNCQINNLGSLMTPKEIYKPLETTTTNFGSSLSFSNGNKYLFVCSLGDNFVAKYILK